MKLKDLSKALKIIAASGTAFIAATTVTMAAKCPTWLPDALCGTGNLLDLTSIVKIVLYLLIAITIIWALINIILAALAYSGKGEDQEAKKKQMQRIISAVVSVVIGFISFTALAIISGWFTGGDLATDVYLPCTAGGKAGRSIKNTDFDPGGPMQGKGSKCDKNDDNCTASDDRLVEWGCYEEVEGTGGTKTYECLGCIDLPEEE